MTPFWSLEPILRYWRLKTVWPYLPQKGIHVDIGCDQPPHLLQKLSPHLTQGIGLDPVIPEHQVGNLTFKNIHLTKTIPLKDNLADSVSMLAVLEHLKYPEAILAQVYRILKPGGVFVFTVPAPPLKYILPTLANLHIVRKTMIDQHENYFTIERLQRLLQKNKYKKFKVRHFAFGLNTLGVAYK